MVDPAALVDHNVIANMWGFPGNSAPTIAIPNLLDPTKSEIAGAQPTTWDNWITSAKSIVLWPVNKVESAYQVVANAPANIENFVTTAENSATAAATGIANWTKYVVIGIVAVLILYVLTFLEPVKKVFSSIAGGK
jgi:hypothetical protein